MNNLYIITTPFQLLSAFEAIYKLKLTNNILIVIDNNLENNAKQLSLLLEEQKPLFVEIIRFGYKQKSNFFNNIKLIKKFKNIKFKYTFIGDLGSIQKIFISNINAEKVFLLDDGAKTILIHKAFDKGQHLFNNSLRQFRFVLFGLKISTNKKINFFTLFNLSQIDNIEIIKHNFEYFKKINNLKNRKIENKIYILGQPLIENQRVKEKAYEEYLNKIIYLYPNCEIYYLMHRRETKEQLLSYNLKKKINIIKSTKPGEFYFAELGYKPKAIIGVNTTLLFSLKKIFDDLEVLSYKIKEENITKSLEWFVDAYSYFNENNIKIIE